MEADRGCTALNMKKSQTPLQTYYAERAPEYDRVYAKPERQQDIRDIQQWLALQFAGARVLDIACGTCFWTPCMVPVVKAILAMDSAYQTLEIARQRVPQEKVKFVVGDVYQLTRDYGLFDAVFAGFWFSHIPIDRRRPFLENLLRVLSPGATVLLLDNRFVQGSSLPITRRDEYGDTFQTRSLDDGSVHEVLKNFPAGHELDDLIRGLGRNATLKLFEYYWAYQFQV